MTSKWYELLKTKCNEPKFFHQFEISYWNGMRECWLSSDLGPAVSRTNNALELCNGHIKDDFTENLLLPANEFLRSVNGRQNN